MVAIISKQGYPKDNEVLAIVNYFVGVPCEGGILIVGQDSQGREYNPRNEPQTGGCYVLPSGTIYTVAIGSDPEKNHPAIYFSFQLDRQRWQPNIVGGVLKETFDDAFFSKFDLVLMDDARKAIHPLDAEVERAFKEIAVWGAYELAGSPKNHFWGEMYRERTPALEQFLEAYRG